MGNYSYEYPTLHSTLETTISGQSIDDKGFGMVGSLVLWEASHLFSPALERQWRLGRLPETRHMKVLRETGFQRYENDTLLSSEIAEQCVSCLLSMSRGSFVLSEHRKYTASTAFFEALWDVCSNPAIQPPNRRLNIVAARLE